MTDYFFIIPIAIALLLGVMSPGPSFIVIAQSAMSYSRKKALHISLGMGIGAMIFAFLACTGLYLLLTTMPNIFFAFKILGGLYLLFLAYKIFINAKRKIENKPLHVEKESSFFKSFLYGLLTQLSNPKTAIVIGGIFAAFLPQSIPPYSYFILCTIAFCLDTAWYSLVSVTLSTKKAQTAYLKYQGTINYFSSFLMLLIAIKLIFDI